MTDSISCPACLSLNAPSLKYCSNCGAALRSPARLAPSAPVPPTTPAPLPAGAKLKAGSYTILQLMGQGGFGITYKARGPNGPVAIKESFPLELAQRLPGGRVMAQDRQEFERVQVRFQNEAEMLQLLTHQSATRFLEFFLENGTAYLVMEYLEGETLEARIARGEALRLMEARKVLFAALGVLRELHGLGWLHRDIKPANLIFTSDRIELIDYGSAVKYKLHERIKRERLLTPMYAPLEQFGETVVLSPATDFYALGATLYHALTLQAPPTAFERAKGVAFKPRDELPAGDHAVTEVIARCLEMRLKDRPHNATELLEVLRRGERPKQDNAEFPRARPYSMFDNLGDATTRSNIMAGLVFLLMALLSLLFPRH